jgi:PD-(D/E)XK nuclease superfamily
MNIFKVLANGDGSINEANISAFLAYLLDPYQDHGLGFEFLDRFISQVELPNFNTEKYDYEIILEQAFRQEDNELLKKQIIDIVVICFENNRGNYKEIIARNLLESPKKIHKIFLIENKVRQNSKTEFQLQSQYDNFICSIKKINEDFSENNIHSIFVTPDLREMDEEFLMLKTTNKTHIRWINESEKENEDDTFLSISDSIFELLKQIVSDEAIGKIEPINEYTKHTLKSFIKFIENDFKSQVVEKKEIKEGKFSKDIYYTLHEYFEKYRDILLPEYNKKILEFDDFIKVNYPKLNVRHSKTHPYVILHNSQSGKLFSFSTYNKRLKLHFVTRNFKDQTINYELKLLLQSEGLRFIESQWGFDVFEDIEIERVKTLFDSYYDIIKNKLNIV